MAGRGVFLERLKLPRDAKAIARELGLGFGNTRVAGRDAGSPTLPTTAREPRLTYLVQLIRVRVSGLER